MYTKYHDVWKNKPDKTTPITAEALMHIETGIETNSNKIDGLELLVPFSITDITDTSDSYSTDARPYYFSRLTDNSSEDPIYYRYTQYSFSNDMASKYGLYFEAELDTGGSVPILKKIVLGDDVFKLIKLSDELTKDDNTEGIFANHYSTYMSLYNPANYLGRYMAICEDSDIGRYAILIGVREQSQPASEYELWYTAVVLDSNIEQVSDYSYIPSIIFAMDEYEYAPGIDVKIVYEI